MINAINNTSVLSTLRSLHQNQQSLNTSLLRLATGKRINSGKDDPAGLIASELLAAEIKVLEAETRSLERSRSNAAIVDGSMTEISSMLIDLKGLVVQSANSGAMSDAEIAANQMQIDNIVGSIQRFTGQTLESLDGVNLPDGGNEVIDTDLANAAAALQGVTSGGPNDLNSGNFDAAFLAIDTAITNVVTARGNVGTYQKYNIEPTIRSNNITIENLTSSRSVIADADFAMEMANLKQFQILVAANIKSLKIAQSVSNSILDLFA